MKFCGIKKLLLVIATGAIAYGGYPILPVQAQSITTTPNNDTNTIINQSGNIIDIEGGKFSSDGNNLFHSFQRFGLESSEIANFISSPNIQNILGRVLGGDPSVIKGLIQVSGGNANLYLLNPAGFIFGSQASLNVPGDFIASTANSVGFGTNWFNVFGSNDYNTLTGTPTSFSFNASQPGSIVNFGDLEVDTGANLRLIGGTVVSTGQLSAPGGSITIAAVPGGNSLRISQPGNLLSLEFPNNASPSGNFTVATLAKLLSNTGFQNTGGLTVNANEQVQLTSTGSLINSGDVVGTEITGGSASLLAAQNLTLPNQIIITGDIILTGNEIDFLGAVGSVSGTGKLTLQPFTSSQNIVVNGVEGTTALDISTQDFAALGNGFSSLVIGANNGSGKITLNPSTVKSDLEVRSPSGTTEINGNITTTGAQTYNSDVKLNNSVELNTTNSAVTFNRKVDNQTTNHNLSVNTGTGNITFNDAVGSTTALGNLSTNSTGTTKFASTVQAASLSTSGGNTQINGNITTTGAQSYNSNVQLTGDIILTANEIDFLGGNASVSGSGKLTLQPFTSSQNIVVNGSEGTAALDISTLDVLALKDGFSSLVIGAGDGSGQITLNPSNNFLDNLEVRSPNGTIEVAKLTVDGNASFHATQTTINSDITTTGTQTYNSDVQLTGDIILTANEIDFLGGNASVSGTDKLTLQPFTSSQNIVVNGVEGTTALDISSQDFAALDNGLSSLVIGANNGSGKITINPSTVKSDLEVRSPNGTTEINGNITTTGAQTYNSDVNLNNSVELSTTNNGAVTFDRKLDNQPNTTYNLTVNAGTGNITFNDAVGNTTALGNLSTNSTGTTKFASTVQAASVNTSSGNTEINGNITTTGAQSYQGTVRLNGDIILTANEIDFLGGNASVSGSGKLTLQPFTSIQNIVVNGSEGTAALDISTLDVLALKDGFSSLVIGAGDGSGQITLNPSNNFLDNLEVRSPNGSILNNGLTVNGTVKLDAATTTLNGNITAQGQIDIPKQILLGANVILNSNGSDITLGSTVDGGRDLTLNAGNTGTLTFGGAVGSGNALTNLTVNAKDTNVGNNITTTGTQTFNSPIQLTGNATFSAGNNIAFNNTIDGSSDLTVFTPANVSLGNIVGGATRLNSLNISAANITASNINTTNNINLIGSNNITTQNITTQGGNIQVTSQNSSITTQNLDSNVDRKGNGGSISLQALGINNATIKTEGINTSSSDGNGGDVTIQAPNTTERNNSILLQWINAEGGKLGGNVDIKTRGFIRSLGSFSDKRGSTATISTIGGRFGDGGTIKIDHGGDGVNPFYVGRADINGTPGRITTGENFINPLEFFANSETRGKIQIITQGQVVPGKDELPAPQVVINNTTSSVASAIANVEDAVTSQFEQKLNLDRVRRKSQQEIISDLQEIEKKTQIKAGLVYVEFSNESLPLNTTKANEQRKDSDPLVLLMVSPDGQLTRHLVPGVNRDNFQKIADEFYKEVALKDKPNSDKPNSSPDLQKLKTTSYKQSAQQLYKWLISPLEVQLKNKGINNLLFVMRDANLRSLPIAALMDEQEKFLIEKYSISIIPSFNLINPEYVQSKNLEVLAMGAENFDPGPNNSNQIKELLAAPIEAETIVNQIWQGRGRTLVNQDFTYKRLARERTPAQPFGIIHLATHAVFTTGDPLKSYIQLYDSKLTLDEVRKLGWGNPQVDLLVLSACQTAYGDEDSMLGLAGAAVKTGVRSVVASLWQVSDTGTLGLMTEFHRQLQKQPIKVEALRKAQLAMIQGTVGIDQEGKNLIVDTDGLTIPLARIAVGSTEAKQLNLKHPFFWSSFTMIGSPW
ncbi:CHAT domain-containing protein [Anabaena azotica]|uniref:CHAT domain-containing protein n=1 Tax=Anabaena azotica FACHB-119 TaxID=947527 RepID=A0ABR8D8Q1_9NOST|nr:CHAT domain-containing protein [Anabaena azotica]MBD2502597.1 CHAT domain-containing protein [Anabaena azotica FACHB-119]